MGKTILFYSEQGLGDCIQFCRYIHSFIALGAKVLVEAPWPLVSLIQRMSDKIDVFPQGKALPDFDYHCSFLSAPLALKQNIPSWPFYLQADQLYINKWQQRLGLKTKPRVGLVWSGSAEHKNDQRRSLHLETLLPYLPADREYICLQREIRECDKDSLTKNSFINFFGEELQSFEDTAALCSLMDVVISVDTSVAHLSAALGCPTWLMLAFNPDWRWFLNRQDSPWYPSVTLFRQDNVDNWSSVLQAIKEKLIYISE